jgi:hypothetical protein
MVRNRRVRDGSEKNENKKREVSQPKLTSTHGRRRPFVSGRTSSRRRSPFISDRICSHTSSQAAAATAPPASQAVASCTSYSGRQQERQKSSRGDIGGAVSGDKLNQGREEGGGAGRGRDGDWHRRKRRGRDWRRSTGGIGGERSRAGLGGWRLGFFTVGDRFYT